MYMYHLYATNIATEVNIVSNHMLHLPVKLTKSSGKAESTSRFGGGASPDGASAGRLLPPAGASMSIIHRALRAVGDVIP